MQQHLGITLAVLAALLLLSGSLRFWQGWLFLSLMSGFLALSLGRFDETRPAIVGAQLRASNAARTRLVEKLWMVTWLPAFTIAGLDFRFGWSRQWLHPMPLWLIVLGQLIAVAGDPLVFWVMKTNSFAGSTIQVGSGQQVIRSGPYATVRHPMYFRHGGDGVRNPVGAWLVSRLALIRVVDSGSDLPLNSRGRISASCTARLRRVLRANSFPARSLRVGRRKKNTEKGILPKRMEEIQTTGAGVGIRGMRERVQQFSGKSTVQQLCSSQSQLVW